MGLRVARKVCARINRGANTYTENQRKRAVYRLSRCVTVYLNGIKQKRIASPYSYYPRIEVPKFTLNALDEIHVMHRMIARNFGIPAEKL